MIAHIITANRIIACLLILLLVSDGHAQIRKGGYSAPNYAQVHAPAGVFTTNTGGVQGGYGLTITPKRSGVVYLQATADLASDTTGFGASIQFDYGTGAPPSQGVIAPAGNGQLVGNHLTVYLAGEPTSEATG